MDTIASLLTRIVATLFKAYSQFCYRTSTFAWTRQAEASLQANWDTALPTIYSFWHDEFLILSLSAHCRRLQFPACVANDTWGGGVVACIWAKYGAPVVRIARAESRRLRIARMHVALCASRRLALAADYGSPWFKVRPTAQTLAIFGAGYVVAMHLHCRRPMVVGYGQWRIRVPTPFNRYTLHLSAPMPAHTATPEALSKALWSLRETARVSSCCFGVPRWLR